MAVIPPPPESKAKVVSSISLPKEKWAEVDEIARRESEKPLMKKAKKTYSRNEIIAYLLDYATEAYWKENPREGDELVDRRDPGGGRERRARKPRP